MEASTNQELDHRSPLFQLPPKILCRILNVDLLVFFLYSICHFFFFLLLPLFFGFPVWPWEHGGNKVAVWSKLILNVKNRVELDLLVELGSFELDFSFMGSQEIGTPNSKVNIRFSFYFLPFLNNQTERWNKL